MKASKKLVVSALSSLIMMMAAGSAMAAGEAPTPVTQLSGMVHFTGDVTDAACTVDVDSSDQTVKLGGVSPTNVAKGKGLQNETRFTIQLDKCSVDTYSTASFDFAGPNDEGGSVLRNTAGADGAQGVGVQLKDIDGKVITIGATSGSGAKMNLVPDTNIASFTAGLLGITDTIVNGKVEATTNFSVHYE